MSDESPRDENPRDESPRADATTSDVPAETPPAGRRRWIRWVGALVLVGLVVSFVVVPGLISSIALPRIIDGIQSETGAVVGLESLSMGWTGRVDLEGLVAHHPDGSTIFEVPEVHANLAMWKALFGTIDVTVSIQDPTLYLARDSTGKPRPRFPRESEPEEPDPDSGQRDLPTVAIELKNARVFLEGPSGPPELLAQVDALVDVGGGSSPARFEVTSRQPSLVTAQGTWSLDSSGTREVEYDLDEPLLLQSFHPVLRELAGLSVLEGRLEGSGQFQRVADGGYEGTGGLTITGLHVERSGWEDRKIAHDRIALAFEKKTLAYEIDDLLSGRITSVPGDGSLRFRMDSNAHADRLIRHLEGFVDLRGYGFGGDTVTVTGDLGFEEGRPRVKGSLRAPRLSVRMPAGDIDHRGLQIDFETLGDGVPTSTAELIESLRRLQGSMALTVDEVRQGELRAGGTLNFVHTDGQVESNGTLKVNGGDVELSGVTDLRDQPDARSTLDLKAAGVEVTRQVAQLLALLHPIFEVGVGTPLEGHLDGNVHAELAFTFDRALDVEIFRGGWEAFPKEAIGGGGHVEVREFQLSGNPLLTQMLAALDVKRPEAIDLNALDFTVTRGRISYDRPMQVKIDGYKSFFTGSVGLDQTLALSWDLPIDEELKKRVRELRHVPLEAIKVAVRGTAMQPRVLFTEALRKIAGGAIQGGVEGVIDKGIGGLLGGADAKSAGALLKEADRLWSQGEQDKAGKLYREIRTKYRSSLTYKLNKSRIKERMR